jgi:hypothetical protein
MSTITFDFRHHYVRGERRESEQIAYQWDLGHVMNVFVPEDATYTIGYCFGDYEKTEDYAIDTKVQDPDGGYKLTAHIPNKYFERSRELRVYVVGTADDHIITTYEGFITIRGRLQPDDYVDDDPENGATQIIEVAREYATKSESFAVGGTGTREGEDTDNAKYYKEQAEAVAESIPEDYSELSDDVDQLKNALTAKAEQDGVYHDLTAGQMLSKNEASDSVPYNFRAVGQDATLEYTDAIVGGSVVMNQLVDSSLSVTKNGITATADSSTSAVTFSGTATSDFSLNWNSSNVATGHKILFYGCPSGGSSSTYYGRNGYYAEPSLFDLGSGKVMEIQSAQPRFIYQFVIKSGTTVNNMAVVPQMFDLTQMFGTTIADYVYTLETATAGSGVAWLKKHFPKMFTYQEYNTGEIVSVQGLSQHVTTGFNQWDEEWELGIWDGSGKKAFDDAAIRSVNYIPVLSNAVYYCYFASRYTSGLIIRQLDASKQSLTTKVLDVSGTFTTSANCRFIVLCSFSMDNITTYNHDICINLSDPTRNGEYEPYQKHTYPLDDSLTLRGILKLDSNNQLYADGDRYLPDGTVQRRFAVVDLGTLSWEYADSKYYRASLNIGTPQSLSGSSNFICSAYSYATAQDIFSGQADKAMTINTSYLWGNTKGVCVRDTSYTDAVTFKAAMSGVYLVYELTTPTIEEADPYTVPQIVDPNGTEEYVSTSIVPVGHESRYPLDIAGRLDKILTMPTANGTYTLRATVNNGAVTYAWVST